MEVWYLKWAWVNFEETEKLPNGWITFPKHVTKNSKERDVPLGKVSRSILLERHLHKRNMWFSQVPGLILIHISASLCSSWRKNYFSSAPWDHVEAHSPCPLGKALLLQPCKTEKVFRSGKPESVESP